MHLVEKEGWTVSQKTIVEDDLVAIQRSVLAWTDPVFTRVDLVIITGGTGFGVRDVTPEAVSAILDKRATGLDIAMLTASLAITPMAALSRPVCGVRKNSVIVTLPGSPKGAVENLSAILKMLPHAVELARGDTHAGESVHKRMALHNSNLRSRSSTTGASRNIRHVGHVCVHKSDQIHDSSDAKISAFGLSRDLAAPVAQRSRKSLYPLVPFDDALELVLSHASLLPAVSMKVSENMINHVLAEDVKVKEPVPNYRASIVDGYAVIEYATGTFQVASVQNAGDNSSISLAQGTVARVTTGAQVPANANAVVMVEDTELVASNAAGEEQTVRILVQAKLGENIREIGSDASVGDVVLQAGSLISAAGGEVGLLASIGHTEVKVYEQPRVAILSTGNELVHYSTPSPLAPPLVRDTNSLTLHAALKTAMPACVVETPPPAKDTADSLAELLKMTLSGNANVVITTGGVSMGETDIVKSVLERNSGAQIWFGRVLMKPGKPTTFATVKRNDGVEKLIFCLPGNPVSALGKFIYEFHFNNKNSTLRKMSGHTTPNHQKVFASLAHPIALDIRPEFYRARLTVDRTDSTFKFVAHGTGSQLSSRLLSMKGANALLLLPGSTKQKEGLEEGEIVEALKLLMAPATPINVIDRDRLYYDLMYRFQYVSKFVDFNQSDIDAVKATAPLIAPLVPTIVDAVYDRLFSFDLTKEIFLQQNDGFHGKLATSLSTLTTEDAQIKFRKDFLAKYLVKLVTAEYDAKFVAYLDRVGRIHTNTPTKKSRINVEYIHCNALFGWLHGFLAETVDQLPQLKDAPQARAKTLAAFSKLLWIQNDFFSMYYLRESERFDPDKGKHTPLQRLGLSGNWVTTISVAAAASAVTAAAVWGLKR
ncbi:hypothetical protein HDU82_003269 [Entophlyctis luteolus]|nr:hypothetical protein HDU82_003269 [Entophlyctis luteolus]